MAHCPVCLILPVCVRYCLLIANPGTGTGDSSAVHVVPARIMQLLQWDANMESTHGKIGSNY